MKLLFFARRRPLATRESSYCLPEPQTQIQNFMGKLYKIHCFVINVYLGYEFGHETYLEFKISIGAFEGPYP